MDVSFIKHHALPVTPTVTLTIHIDIASIVIGRDQAQVVTQRTGIRVAVAIELAAWRQLGKHRGLDGGNAFQDSHTARAQFGG